MKKPNITPGEWVVPTSGVVISKRGSTYEVVAENINDIDDHAISSLPILIDTLINIEKHLLVLAINMGDIEKEDIQAEGMKEEIEGWLDNVRRALKKAGAK